VINAATVIAAEPVFTVENIGVLTALILAIAGAIATIIGALSKAKLDDKAELEKDLTKAKDALAEAEAQHARDIARYEARVAELEDRLDARDRTINKLDRLVLALRGYIARLSRHIVDRGDEVPQRPAEIDL
jgi:peptidoglycan hydrolase CwlO-like protein